MKFKNPFITAADPFVLLHDGKYYLYATTDPKNGYLVYESEDFINWENRGHCLIKNDVMGEENFWAPEVMYYNGKFYMVYTSEFHLGVAVSDSPLGPFKQSEKKWLREGRAIDGHFFQDNGKVYLYYVNYEHYGEIFGCELSEDISSLIGEEKRLLFPEYEWELMTKYEKDGRTRCVIEGPFMLKHEGKYHLSYSSNDTQSPYYAIGCAVSDEPLGKFEKYPQNPILKRNEFVNGPGHHSFTTTPDGKRIICVYHTHQSLVEWQPRVACADFAEFVDGCLKIDGPTR